jgi:hypothetical protein
MLTARGSQDAFIAKYAPDDSLLWVRRMGGDYTDPGLVTDACRDVSVDSSGNVFVAGEFHATADFGSTTLTSAGGKDAFVTKLSASGNFLWTKRWGTMEDDQSYGGDVDAQGNVYAVSMQADGGYDIVKFTAAGSQSWTRSLTGTSWTAPDLDVSPTGSVYVAGTFEGRVDFDPSTKTKYISSGPSRAAFVLNLDAAGKYKWITPFVGRTVNSTSGYAFAHSVTVDAGGNVVVGGQYRNTVDFNPGSAVTTLDPVGGAFIAKLNASGGLVWARALANAGSTSGPTTYGLATDAAGNIYASGTFSGSVDLDPGAGADIRTTVGSTDVFVAKLTAAGNYVWGETFGGVGSDSSLGIAVDSAGDVHVAMFYADQVDFDPSPLASYTLGSPGGARNGLRLKLRQS